MEICFEGCRVKSNDLRHTDYDLSEQELYGSLDGDIAGGVLIILSLIFLEENYVKGVPADSANRGSVYSVTGAM